MDYWLNPVSLKSYEFLTVLKRIKNIFGDFVKIRPFYKFKNLQKEFREMFLKEHCYVEGKFCGVEDSGFESLSVLNEGLRQICLFETTKKDSEYFIDDQNLWWDYVLNYKHCLLSKIKVKNAKQEMDCYKEVFYRNKITENVQKKIGNCIKDSFLDNFVDRYRSRNNLLEKNKNKKDYKNIYLVPAIFLNDNLLKEDLKENIVISAICDKLKSKPQACKKYLEVLDWEGNSKLAIGKGFLSVFFFFIIGLGALFVFLMFLKKRIILNMKKEADFEIQSHISNYMKLQNTK